MDLNYTAGQAPTRPRNLGDVLLRSSSPAPSNDTETNWISHVTRVASLDFSALWRSDLPPLSHDTEKSGSSIIHVVEAQIKRGSPINFGTFGAAWDALKNQNGVGLDDRKYLLEEVLVFMSRLPPGSKLATQVEHFMIDFLYRDLPHPPSTYLGPFMPSTPAKENVLGLKGFAYREADGSSNNPLIPDLGAAHKHYARSVASTHVAPLSTLPDPGLVFDTLLKRDKPVEHPTGLSSMFFAFANLIIHSLFRTNRQDWSVNDTSSYLDLSPLYGVDQQEQNGVRRFDGTGQLWNDTFADMRLLGMPPSVAALLIIFNRNHNFVANRILNINERGVYFQDFSISPDLKEEEKKAKEKKIRAQDDEIFNRARLVNCGAFMQVIMRDYVGSILNMIPELTAWHLRPLDPIRDSHHEITPRGEGNVCSVEFNLLYRWHATTSTKDEKWLEEMWKRLFPGRAYDQVTEEEFGRAAAGELRRQGGDPKKWTFGSLQRNEQTGRFSDGDLAGILQGATADAAHAFRARGIPATFRVIEMLGIEQARSWGVCSLNEFRSFLGLKPYASFQEWNSDHTISEAAEHLYHHIDNMELYVGMQAEESRPSIPGSGLCSGFTMSRSILADAVALIRGDRFLTIEYTPFNLTSWGFQDVETTDDNGSLGGMLTKLLFRTLPQHYTPASIYAHFPFIVPNRMHENMSKDGSMLRLYDFSEPRAISVIHPVSDYETVKEIATNTTAFSAPYETNAAYLTQGDGFFLGAGDSTKHRRNRGMVESVLFTPQDNSRHAQYYYDKTLELIADKSYFPVGIGARTVDIVREVINFVPLHWIATHVVALPLRTKENPNGKWSEQELYSYLAVIFTFIFLDSEPVNTWFLKQHSRKAAKALLAEITLKLTETTSLFSAVRGVVGKLSSHFIGNTEQEAAPDALNQLLRKYADSDDESGQAIVHNIFGVMVNSVANWSHAMTHVVNFYLDPSRKNDKDAIVALSARPVTEETDNLLIGFVREALRLDPPVAGVLRTAQGDVSVQGTHITGRERVYVNLAAAVEAHLGADASFVNPNRLDNQLAFVPGAHSSLNQEFSDKTMAQVLRAVFSKKNLRRAPGRSGQLTRFTEDLHGTSQKVYIDSKGQPTPWPQSLLVQYDV